MSVVAQLCGLTGAPSRSVVVTRPPEVREAARAAQSDGFELVEPDLPIGRLKLPRDVIDRAVLATVVRGRARELLFVRGHKGGVVKVREAAALDLWIARSEGEPKLPSGSPLTDAAMGIVAARTEPIHGKELLREVRAIRSASASDAKDLARAIVAGWNDGLLALCVR